MQSKFIFLFLLLFFFFHTNAQEKYWQQEVNSQIEVELFDQTHLLKGNIKIEYINNSPDDLDTLYFHLWPNAYRNRSTAFAEQQLQNGSTDFYFAADEDLGYIDSLNFQSGGKELQWMYHPDFIDIALIFLPSTLNSGEKIRIETPFLVKIPASFSRLGHVGESYQITQWYPKPAVYDKKGWHPMPYLDQGEFYSEFGSFDVSITLPKNYVVAATGELRTASEYDFLEERVKEANIRIDRGFSRRNGIPPSSPEKKTIRFVAKDVHDFAWFADKRFYVQKSSVQMPSGRTVDTWAYFTNDEANLWKDATTYLDRAVLFYAQYVGEYPYPHASAVQSALSAGAGMEYPMITVIGLSGDAVSLDQVIAHEVGHNWFYGILAFDERAHPWLDEGINSYYEKGYMDAFHPKQNLDFLPRIVTGGIEYDLDDLGYLFQARRRLDQPPTTHSADFSSINYFIGAYSKPSKALKVLEESVGAIQFDSIMHTFYEKWKFKHPQPEDFKAHWMTNCDQDLSWFFDGMIGSANQVDYAISGIRKKGNYYNLTLKNKGKVNLPISLTSLDKDKEPIETEYLEGFTGKQEIQVPQNGNERYFILDNNYSTLDVYRYNNLIRTRGLFKKIHGLNPRVLGGVENPERTSFFLFPALAWNNYDKLLFGAAIYNKALLNKRLEFGVIPFFSPLTREIAGIGEVRYNWYFNKGAFDRIQLGMTARSFHYEYTWQLPDPEVDKYLKYERIAPYLAFYFAKAARSRTYQELRLRPVFWWQDDHVFSNDGKTVSKEKNSNWSFDINYVLTNRSKINPFRLQLEAEYLQTDFINQQDLNVLRTSLEFIQHVSFAEGRRFSYRIFAGAMPVNEVGHETIFAQSFAATYEGFNDFNYDHFFFGRSDQTGIWTQQVMLREGGMKTAFGSPFANLIGQSNDFLLALNLKSELPLRMPAILPVKPYFDMVLYDNTVDPEQATTFLWSGGLSLEYGNGVFGIYFPIINSSEINDIYGMLDNRSYWRRVSFTLDLAKLHPWRVVERLEF